MLKDGAVLRLPGLVKPLKWIALLFMTLGPLLPQEHLFAAQFKTSGLFAANLLLTLSGFSTHLRFANSAFRPRPYYQAKFIPPLLGTLPIYLFALLMALLTFSFADLFLRLTPFSSLLHFTLTPASSFLPLLNYSFALLACWAIYPLLIRPLDNMNTVNRISAAVLLPLANCLVSFALVRFSPNLIRGDTTNLLIHPLYKIPIFITGVLAASVVDEVRAWLRHPITKDVVLDCSTLALFLAFFSPRTSVLSFFRSSILVVWFSAILCLVATLITYENNEQGGNEDSESLVSSNSGTRLIRKTHWSISYHMLSSDALQAVLEDRADSAYALLYKLILCLYTPAARNETLESGHGFLFYVLCCLLASHLYSYYYYTPISKYCYTDFSFRFISWKTVHDIFIGN